MTPRLVEAAKGKGNAMLDGRAIVEDLAARRAGGASRDELLRRAVEAIEAADDRFDWVGVYLLEASGDPASTDELVLHNYVGRPTDHVRIPVGTGVCGAAVAEGRDINVPDVEAIDNYLACSVETKSELVVLIRDPETGEIRGQIDLDSDERGAFTDRDERELRVVADWLGALFG